MNAIREIPPEERASQTQDTWQAVGAIALRLAEKVTRQRAILASQGVEIILT